MEHGWCILVYEDVSVDLAVEGCQSKRLGQVLQYAFPSSWPNLCDWHSVTMLDKRHCFYSVFLS